MSFGWTKWLTRFSNSHEHLFSSKINTNQFSFTFKRVFICPTIQLVSCSPNSSNSCHSNLDWYSRFHSSSIGVVVFMFTQCESALRTATIALRPTAVWQVAIWPVLKSIFFFFFKLNKKTHDLQEAERCCFPPHWTRPCWRSYLTTSVHCLTGCTCNIKSTPCHSLLQVTFWETIHPCI